MFLPTGTGSGTSVSPPTTLRQTEWLNASVASIQTHYVKLEGQEAMWTKRSSWEMSVANGSAKTMETESRRMGNGAGRIAQRAAHSMT